MYSCISKRSINHFYDRNKPFRKKTLFLSGSSSVAASNPRLFYSPNQMHMPLKGGGVTQLYDNRWAHFSSDNILNLGSPDSISLGSLKQRPSDTRISSLLNPRPLLNSYNFWIISGNPSPSTTTLTMTTTIVVFRSQLLENVSSRWHDNSQKANGRVDQWECPNRILMRTRLVYFLWHCFSIFLDLSSRKLLKFGCDEPIVKHFQ